MHEDSLVEGMKELMPVYCVIGKISVYLTHKQFNNRFTQHFSPKG